MNAWSLVLVAGIGLVGLGLSGIILTLTKPRRALWLQYDRTVAKARHEWLDAEPQYRIVHLDRLGCTEPWEVWARAWHVAEIRWIERLTEDPPRDLHAHLLGAQVWKCVASAENHEGARMKRRRLEAPVRCLYPAAAEGFTP
jgi:hypothetical protein